MSKSKKIFLRVIPVILVLMVFVSTNVFGFSDFKANMTISTDSNVGSVNTAVGKIWGTVTLILQMLAVAAIVIAGVRYMFAAPDAKADIKKQTVGLVVGAILVFAASGIVGFLVDVTNEVTNNAGL